MQHYMGRQWVGFIRYYRNFGNIEEMMDHGRQRNAQSWLPYTGRSMKTQSTFLIGASMG
jgi:hypothetical protein